MHYIGNAGLPGASGAISPGPYRSLRELSLAGLLGSDTRRPPTCVGNPGSNAPTAGAAPPSFFGFPGALSILKGAVPGRAPGLGHTAPTYLRREPGIERSDGRRGSALIFRFPRGLIDP